MPDTFVIRTDFLSIKIYLTDQKHIRNFIKIASQVNKKIMLWFSLLRLA